MDTDMKRKCIRDRSVSFLLDDTVAVIIGTLLVFSLAGKLFVATHYEINWDEFYYLSSVYKLIRQDALSVYQTFHVHFFTWLKLVSENEVHQIVVARYGMVLLQLITAYFIFKIARSKFSFSASLFAVLSYFSFSYVMKHGASFRTDPIATCFLMATLYLIIEKSDSWKFLLLSTVTTSLAIVVTIKSALYFPVIFLLFVNKVYWSKERKKQIVRFVVFALSVVLISASLYSIHTTLMEMLDVVSDPNMVQKSANKTLLQTSFFPSRFYWFDTFIFDFVYWLVFLYAVRTVLVSIIYPSSGERETFFYLIFLSIPVMSLLVYRNAFPYFYSFMLAPASVLCAAAWSKLSWRGNRKKAMFFSVSILSAYALSITFHGFLLPHRFNLKSQEETLDVIHSAFPQPVPYIDRCSMVSSYPQKGFFMSSWGLENYSSKGVAAIDLSVRSHKPVFVLVNSNQLDVFDNRIYTAFTGGSQLVKQDIQALYDNYIHHWGNIYVAGKSFALTVAQPRVYLTLYIDGFYTLEGESPVMVNGMRVEPEQALYLSSGEHSIHAIDTESKGEYRLRWGERLFRPSKQSEGVLLFNKWISYANLQSMVKEGVK